MTETSINYLGDDKHAVISTDERKWVNRIHALKEEYPDQVEIRSVFKDGTVVAHFPKAWVKVRPPAKKNLSEEQKQVLAERMRFARSSRGKGKNTEGDDEEE